jgi:hypothetical protein
VYHFPRWQICCRATIGFAQRSIVSLYAEAPQRTADQLVISASVNAKSADRYNLSSAMSALTFAKDLMNLSTFFMLFLAGIIAP